jgi:murein DD-endopeptidase MepM/ murein hydrolase activator NlpD
VKVKIIFIFILFATTSFLPVHAAGDWYYPIGHFATRESDKKFDQYIDKKFYLGRESTFPHQFIGYHAAIDLEISPSERNLPVPVYAVAPGKIVYAASVAGYGGLILEQLAGTGDTALYGHVKLTGLTFNIGDNVSGGRQLTELGDAFSLQTDGERKHLHFGIYKGTDLYFRGYETSQDVINTRWLNPTTYLNSYSAIDPESGPTPVVPTPTPFIPSKTSSKTPGFFATLFQNLGNFFKKILKH